MAAGVTANLGLMEICFSVVEIGDDNFQKVARVMKERASVAGMEDPDVPSGGNTSVRAGGGRLGRPSDSDSSYD